MRRIKQLAFFWNFLYIERDVIAFGHISRPS